MRYIQTCWLQTRIRVTCRRPEMYRHTYPIKQGGEVFERRARMENSFSLKPGHLAGTRQP